ncbi:hypothetical protein [Sphingosinicella terrae]|jgi:hypothetical protein|uniref:hypothetical protein n=1 Tax=Sphingosinicella terrae TaxID=2172047 RepID=UPI000E0D1051|nr:hypothetical protein [Sphingosinicella terrae]
MSGSRSVSTARAAAVLACAGALVLAACETVPQRGRVTFQCERSGRITVIFQGERARLITPDGGFVELRRRRSRTGFWFESPTHSIRGRGNALSYTVGRMMPVRCTAVRPSR